MAVELASPKSFLHKQTAACPCMLQPKQWPRALTKYYIVLCFRSNIVFFFDLSVWSLYYYPLVDFTNLDLGQTQRELSIVPQAKENELNLQTGLGITDLDNVDKFRI